MKKGKEFLEKTFFMILAVIIFFTVWQLAVTFTAIKETTPAPAEVLQLLFHSMIYPIGTYTIWGHLLISLGRVLIGFGIAAILGIAIGIGMGRSMVVRGLIRPVFELMRSIPPIAWIPIGILWFGIGESSKYFIIFIAAFTIITVNAFTAATNVDEQLIGAAKMLGANDIKVFKEIIMPSSLPQVFAGLQVGLSSSWCAVLAAEMVSSTEGCGWIIIRGSNTANVTQVMVGMIIIAVAGMILATLMRTIERKMCSWNEVNR